MEKFLVILIVMLAVVGLVIKFRKTFKNGECSCADGCGGCSACKPLDVQVIDMKQNRKKGEEEHE